MPASDRAGKEPPILRYDLTALTGEAAKPEANKRFYLGGQVYGDWSEVPDRYKVTDTSRTPWGSQVALLFSFKW